MRRWMMILMVAMLCLTMAACSSEQEDLTASELMEMAAADEAENKKDVEDKTIVGTWELEAYSWIFNEDGTGYVSMKETAGGEYMSKFYYTAKDGVLTLKTSDETKEVTYKIEGDKLTISGEDAEPTVYTRKK